MIIRNISTKPAAAVAFSSILLLGACGSAPGGTPIDSGEIDLSPIVAAEEAQMQIRGLYEEAVADGGNVTIYGTVIGSMDPIVAAFEERFPGVDLQVEVLRGSEREARLQAEEETGRHVVDVLESPYPSSLDGEFEAYKPILYVHPSLQNGVLSADLASPKDDWFVPFINVVGPVVGEDAAAEELPSSWQELADPKWGGRIVGSDPSRPSTHLDTLAQLMEAGTIDREWLDTYAANLGLLVGSTPQLTTEVVSGAFELGMAGVSLPIGFERSEGVPVKVMQFDENNLYGLVAYGVAADAPNPAGARLFIEFLHSMEAGALIAELGGVPINPDSQLPPGFVALEELNTDNVVTEADMDAIRAKYTPIFAEVFGGAAR